MSATVEDLHRLKLEDPICVTLQGVSVYGRLARFAGNEYRGVYPQVVLRTPHGSEITSGIVFVRRLTSDEDLAKLAGFDTAAAASRAAVEAPPSGDPSPSERAAVAEAARASLADAMLRAPSFKRGARFHAKDDLTKTGTVRDGIDRTRVSDVVTVWWGDDHEGDIFGDKAVPINVKDIVLDPRSP